MFFRRFRTFGVDWTPLLENFFLYAKNFGAPLAPPQGPPRGPSLGLPFWNQKLTYKLPLHQIWHTFHNLKPPPQKSTFRPTLSFRPFVFTAAYDIRYVETSRIRHHLVFINLF